MPDSPVNRSQMPVWLRLLLGLIVVANLVTIVGAINNLHLQLAPALTSLTDLPLSPASQLISASAAVIVFAALLIACQRRIWTAYTLVAPLLTLYALFGLAWNLLLTRSTYSRA